MSDPQDEICLRKERWERAKAKRRSAHDRMMAAFTHFVAGAARGPSDNELARLKLCIAVEDEVAHDYVVFVERSLRG